MATTEKVKNQLAKKGSGKKSNTIMDLLNNPKMKSQIQRALPNGMSAERIARIALTALRMNPELQECSPQSFVAALMTSAQLGLEPNTPLGHAWLIPRKNHGKMEVQFEIGYKGTLDLVRRSGEIKAVFAEAVYEKDYFEFEYGTNPYLRHKPFLDGDRGKVRLYYAVAIFKDGGYAFKVMSIPEIEKYRKLSPSANSPYSPWNNFYDDMAKKTVLKQLCKLLPLSIETQRGLAQDETIRTQIETDDILDFPNENEFEVVEVGETPVEEGKEEPKEGPFPNKALRRESPAPLT